MSPAAGAIPFGTWGASFIVLCGQVFQRRETMLLTSGRAIKCFRGFIEFEPSVRGPLCTARAQLLHLFGTHWLKISRDAQVLPQHLQRIDATDSRGHREAH